MTARERRRLVRELAEELYGRMPPVSAPDHGWDEWTEAGDARLVDAGLNRDECDTVWAFVRRMRRDDRLRRSTPK